MNRTRIGVFLCLLTAAAAGFAAMTAARQANAQSAQREENYAIYLGGGGVMTSTCKGRQVESCGVRLYDCQDGTEYYCATNVRKMGN